MATKRVVQHSTAKDTSATMADPPTLAMVKDAGDAFAEHAPAPDPKLKDHENPAKPWMVSSPRDFEDISQEMIHFFEGRESEQTFDKRRKAIIKLSRVTHGNGPVDYHTQYISFIKSQLDAILKAVDSLRTNVSSAGLNLLQHIAATLGQGIDFMVDFVTETLITRCCNTSKIKRDPAIMTVEAIFKNATCNKNILHYILSASEHKDPNARTAVPTWLTALVIRNGRHYEQTAVLDLIEKCIKNGLYDSKPQVRTPMRFTYETYASLWPDRADRLKDSLDAKTQKILGSNNPSEPPKPPTKRPSIRDLKAAKMKEMDASEAARPASAQAERSSIKDMKKNKMKEVETKAGTTSASANQLSVRDGKGSKTYNGEVGDTVRASSAQSNHATTRDTKIARKRDVVSEDTAQAPASQSHNRNDSRDLDLQGSARPGLGHSQTASMDRKFHIISGPPMRPQRSLTTEAKRVAPKPARPLQQPTDRAIVPPPHAEDHRSSRRAEKRPQRAKTETVPDHQPDVPRSEESLLKRPEVGVSNSETQTNNMELSAPPPTETEATANVVASVPAPLQHVDGMGRKDEHVAGTSRRGRSPPKHNRAQAKKPLKVHEDKAPVVQTGRAKGQAATRRSSSEKSASSKGTTSLEKKPSSERLNTASSAAKIHSRKSSLTSPGVAKANGTKGSITPPKVGKVNGRRRSVTVPDSPAVLREIEQLNDTLESVKKQDTVRQKFISTETAERNKSVSPHDQTPEKARKQLSEAIEKIRARRMDDYDHRRLQGLIKMHDTLFGDEEKFDELLLALLDALEAADKEKRVPLGRPYNSKFQILVTVRLMLEHNSKYCVAYQSRVLCALIGARRNFKSRCHIVGGLEKTADEIVAACSPEEVMDAVLDVLELEEDDDAGHSAMLLGFNVLRGLTARMPGNEIQDKVQQERLTRLASKWLHNEDSEIRRGAIGVCVEARRLIEPEEKYFRLVAGRDASLRSLLTYFLTK